MFQVYVLSTCELSAENLIIYGLTFYVLNEMLTIALRNGMVKVTRCHACPHFHVLEVCQ